MMSPMPAAMLRLRSVWGAARTRSSLALPLAMAASLAMTQAATVGAAEPSSQVRAALEVLAGSRDGASAAAEAPAGKTTGAVDAVGQARTTVDVIRGQTLESLIRAHFGKSPLKPEVVREVLIKLNPQALGPDGRKRLVPGTAVNLPTRDDLVRHAFGAGEAQALAQAALAAQALQAEAASASQGAAAAARRGWVRYP